MEPGFRQFEFFLARLNPNGTLDNSFHHDGKLDFQVNSLDNAAFDVNVQKDGKIVVVGSSFTTPNIYKYSFIKLNNDGSFDNSFGTGGKVSYDFGLNGLNKPHDALIQDDGKIVAAGIAYADGINGFASHGFGIMRLNNSVGTAAPYTCNYTVQSDFTVVGDARGLGSACYELTPSELGRAGAIWYNDVTPFFNLNQNFTITAELHFGALDNGADGIAFVLQPVGATVLGEKGGGLGYMGIAPSFVVEFDTYHNDEPWFDVGDPQQDHIGFMKNGSPYHKGPISGALLPPISLPVNIEDDQYHHVEFKWNASNKTMIVSFLGNTYTYTGKIVDSLFGGNPNVYFGFTAATGSPLFNVSQNVQRVCNVSVITNTGIASTDKGVTAQPNPTTGNVYLKLEEDLKGKGKLTVLNSSGAVIVQQQMTFYGRGQLIPLSLGNAARGMYLVEIRSERGGMAVQKVIKN
jgi:uncharacterized delta-60 repeat protein